MAALPALSILMVCATLAHGQVTLPGTRRPEQPKPSEPAPGDAKPTPPPTIQPAPTTPVPPSFPGNLPPIIATTPLSDEQLAVDYAGLTMSLPVGSVMVQGANTEGTVYSIRAEDRTWAIEVQVRQTSNADSTVHDTAALVTRNVENIAPTVRPGKGEVEPKVGSSVELLQRLTAFSITGCSTPGERLYFAVPGTGGSRQIMGYTILKPMPTTFVIFQLTCDESNLAKARSAYEIAVATAKFEDPSKAIAARASSLAAGTEFLSQMNEERLVKLADDSEHWSRWYTPGAQGGDQGAAEIGYRIVKVSKGRRSDIGAEGGGGRDNPSGLVVLTQVRLLQRGAGRVIAQIDSETRAFSSFDRKDEAWVTTTVSRDLKTPDAKPVTFSETGVRSGGSMSIVTRIPGKGDSVMQPTLRSTQYVTMAEGQLLGSMLVLDAGAKAKAAGPAAEVGPTELGFYAYRADAGTISLRRETVGRDPKRANAWTVRSRLRDEKVVTLSVYRDDGGLVRTELPDGSVWEPIEPEALLKLWKSKNLPVTNPPSK